MDVSAYSMQGRRTHMEDFFDIGYQLKPASEVHANDPWPYEYFYFAIFDGHGGDEAASFAKQSLLKMIVRQPDFWSNDDEDVMRAIRQGFADTHSAMRARLSTWSRTNKTLPSTAGTTASVLFIKNGKFFTGHVGDSRIVISKKHPETKQWISHQMTEDHKPESESEIERIKRAGGDVKPKFGVHRVVWRRPIWNKEFSDIINADPNTKGYEDSMKKIETYPVEESVVDYYQVIPFLAIARSLGDFWSINPHSGQFIVSPEPDVTCRPIEADDNCILLATDGLWNVMSSMQAVRFLQELKVVKDGERNSKEHSGEYFATDNFYDVSMPKAEKNHALSLVYLAYQLWERRRMRSDNITAVVAMLGDILPPAQARTSTRRSSREHIIDKSKNLKTIEYILDNTRQLQKTHIFCERITSKTEPVFYAHPVSENETKMWQKIEEHLVFPPTVFCHTAATITPPINYDRLSNAKCRLLTFDSDYYSDDAYIYIKSVSDDPADEREEPTRMNKKKKLVRDSSCQASQPIHDFGQPWHQMEECENDEFLEERESCELVRESSLKLGDMVLELNGYIKVDEAYLERVREKSSKKKRRYDSDSSPFYGPCQTRSNQAHCV